MEKIVVGIAEGKTAVEQQVLISYALGSCVGVCLYDKSRKIAGMVHETGRPEWEIGAQNVASVKKTLAEEGIRLIAEDTGKNYGRTVSFYAGDGKMEVRTVRHETVVL